MRGFFRCISSWFAEVGLAFRATWLEVVHDAGAMLFFIVLPLFYPVVYTLIYNPEVVTDIPVAVIDDCRTQASRDLVQMADAAPAVDIYDYVPNMADARRLMAERKVYAILHIPRDYGKKINTGEQTTVTLVCDMSLLLRYRALLTATTALQLRLAQDITAAKVSLMGMDSAGNISGLPIESDSHFLGDTQSGFASFIIPGIVVLILQQSMVLGIVLLGATSIERRRRNRGIDPRLPVASASAATLGKALCFISFYLPATIYVLHYIPVIFDLPHYGSAVDYLLFIFPMLVATAFFGQALVGLVKERDDTFLIVVFTSVVMLFLSGLTWPRYAMPVFWKLVGDLVPATLGVEGFVRINSNGATLAENADNYIGLWLLSLGYFIVASLVQWHLSRKYRNLPAPAANA